MTLAKSKKIKDLKTAQKTINNSIKTHKMVIDGQLVDSHGLDKIEIECPATKEILHLKFLY